MDDIVADPETVATALEAYDSEQAEDAADSGRSSPSGGATRSDSYFR